MSTIISSACFFYQPKASALCPISEFVPPLTSPVALNRKTLFSTCLLFFSLFDFPFPFSVGEHNPKTLRLDLEHTQILSGQFPTHLQSLSVFLLESINRDEIKGFQECHCL